MLRNSFGVLRENLPRPWTCPRPLRTLLLQLAQNQANRKTGGVHRRAASFDFSSGIMYTVASCRAAEHSAEYLMAAVAAPTTTSRQDSASSWASWPWGAAFDFRAMRRWTPLAMPQLRLGQMSSSSRRWARRPAAGMLRSTVPTARAIPILVMMLPPETVPTRAVRRPRSSGRDQYTGRGVVRTPTRGNGTPIAQEGTGGKGNGRTGLPGGLRNLPTRYGNGRSRRPRSVAGRRHEYRTAPRRP